MMPQELVVYVSDVVTAVASTSIAGLVFMTLRRVLVMMAVIDDVKKFIAESRVENRKNQADHDLFADRLNIPRTEINQARRLAGINGGDRGQRDEAS